MNRHILTARANWDRSTLRQMFRTVWLAVAFVCSWPAFALAVDPTRLISQYAHTAWRVQDGFFRGSPFAFAQTRDGYLWIGTDSGVLRFDGVRFVPWDAERDGTLPNMEVMDLLAARDGSLWIATLGGLSQWKDRRLTNHQVGPGGATMVFEDSHGTIWFSRRFADADGRTLCQVVNSTPRCLGSADGVALSGAAHSVMQDRAGNLWLGGETMLLRWSPGSQTAYVPEGLRDNVGIAGISALAEAQDGALWVGISKSGPGLGLQRLTDGAWTSLATPDFDGSALSVTSLHHDREGALWIGTMGRGIYRVHGAVVDHFDRTAGLSGNLVQAVSEDREGNIWVTTSEGLDRFSDTPVVSFSSRQGLCSPEAASVVATRDGSIWTGGEGALSRLRAGVVSCLRSGSELPGSQVTSLFEDRAGRLWVGLDDGLWVYERQRFREVRGPASRRIGMVTSIAEDVNQRIWIAVSGPPRVLMRIEGLAVQEEYPEPPLPRRISADPNGGLWLGLLTGNVARWQDGKFNTYTFATDDAGLLHQLAPQPDGSLLAATSFGLIGVHHGRQATLTVNNGLPCDAVNAFAFDAQNNLWLFLSCGLTQVSAAELQRWKEEPGAQISVRTLDEHDGVRMGRAAFDAAARSTDGRLWFSNGAYLQSIDPARLRPNTVPPPVHIEQVIADRRSYGTRDVVQLPARTRDIQIDYVALSFAAPQKVQYRYWLEGRDTQWQEPGGRRQAFYSDLRPGSYRFRVIASNNDGLWNEEGAAVEFVVAAAWYQTSWFILFCGVTALATAWAVYRIRLRQVARMLTARFDERLAERTRLARDLHDTLLQTVQGSKMVADQALESPHDAGAMRHAMQQVSTWLGQAAVEGRTSINRLRASAMETNDLAAAFRRAIDDCSRLSTMTGHVSVTGNARDLHPVVRDEVYRIGYEAIRNACVHSHGTHLQVSLMFSKDFTLRVADDGVGIDSQTAARGKPDHLGLQTMRERAERIGATLSIAAETQGTHVVLTVPGGAIFTTSRTGFDQVRGH